MTLISKLNALLSKFVGPNAAHMVDAAVAVGIVDGAALVSSPSARAYLVHHAVLSSIASICVPPAVALASKFRKAAGSQADLVDQIAQVVQEALAKQQAPVQK